MSIQKKLLSLFLVISIQLVAENEVGASLRMKMELTQAIGEVYPGVANSYNYSNVLQQLDSKSAKARRRAVSRLKYFSDKHDVVVPLLIKFLEDPNAEVREEAAWSLSFLHKDANRAVPALAKSLEDKEWGPKRAAAYALALIGAQEIFPQLVKSKNSDVRAMTARILHNMEEEVLPFTDIVKQLLQDKDEKVSGTASWAWENIEKHSAQKAIVQAISHSASHKDPLIRRAALKYLRSLRLKDMGVSTLHTLVKLCKDSDEKIRTTARDILLGLDGKKAPPSQKVSDGHVEVSRWSVRRRIKRSLQQLDMNSAAKEIPDLITRLNSSDWKDRKYALSRLGEIGKANSQVVIPAIVRCLSDDDEEVQAEAAFALGNLGELAHSTAPDLIKRLSTKYQRLRRGIAMSLAEIGATKKVLQLAQSTDPEMRYIAALVLYDLEEKALNFTDTIQQLLQDPQKYVRETAQHSWGNVQKYEKFSKDAEEVLKLTTNKSVEKRLMAVKFLSSVGVLAIPSILSLLQDSDHRVRQAARQVLLKRKEMEAAASLKIIKRLVMERKRRQKMSNPDTDKTNNKK